MDVNDFRNLRRPGIFTDGCQNMAIEYLDFTEDSFPLVRDLVSDSFGKGALNALQKMLDNHIRKKIVSAGCIALKN